MFKAVFSKHAIERIEEGDSNGPRTSLNVEEVAEILNDASKHIWLCNKNGFCYKLFYSNEDNNYLISVQGEYGHVITIKPLKYFKGKWSNKISNKILEKDLEKAEIIASSNSREIKI